MTFLKHLFKPSIEVFVRYCHFSDASSHKKRFPFFNREECYLNLLETAKASRVNFTFLLDTFYEMKGDHFIKKQKKYPVIEIKEGNEAGSFSRLLDHVASLSLNPETLIYFVEDDYLHRPNWPKILAEGLSLPDISYVTLYDHKDKYDPSYKDLASKIFITESCHWRTTPSTTNTYAMKFGTLMRDLPIHRQFSQDRKITSDHLKFLALAEKGAILASSIPGWSTHAEPEFASPCLNWEEILYTF